MKAQQALGPAFIGAIGVVFGDIGTSPLYAFKESLGAAGFQPGRRVHGVRTAVADLLEPRPSS